MSLVKKHTDMAIAFITAVFIAFSSPWIGISVGIVLSLLLTSSETIDD